MVSTWRNRFAIGLGACVLLCVGLLGPLAGAARADGTGLTWPSDPVHLTQKGSAFIGSFTVFNPSGAKVLVSIPTTSAPCHMMLQTGTSVPVDPYSGAVVAVTTTGKCSASDAADLQFDAHAATSAADGSKSDDKQLSTQAQPDWHKLALLFAVGAGIALVATLIGFALAKGTRQHFTWYVKVDSGVPTSWTTNLTALGALFSGFFVTTGLLKSILGTDPTAQLGFIAVGAALGVVLSGAAGLVTGAPTGGTASPRVWQFLLGSLLTAAGALGQVGVVAVAVDQLHIGLSSTLIWVCAGLAAALLFIYLIASVKFYIDRYAVPPPTPVAAAGGAAPAVAPPGAPRQEHRQEHRQERRHPRHPLGRPRPASPGPPCPGSPTRTTRSCRTCSRPSVPPPDDSWSRVSSNTPRRPARSPSGWTRNKPKPKRRSRRSVQRCPTTSNTATPSNSRRWSNRRPGVRASPPPRPTSRWPGRGGRRRPTCSERPRHWRLRQSRHPRPAHRCRTGAHEPGASTDLGGRGTDDRTEEHRMRFRLTPSRVALTTAATAAILAMAMVPGAAASNATPSPVPATTTDSLPVPAGAIKHVIVIDLENESYSRPSGPLPRRRT